MNQSIPYQNQQHVELPHQLAGPFLREFDPQGRYRQRSSQLAAVLYYRNGGCSVVTVQGAAHERRPWLRRAPTTVNWIARGRHQSSFGLPLPAYRDTASFQAEADVNWEVVDYRLTAERRVVDVARMLRPPLMERLREITRRYRLDDAQQADEAIRHELGNGDWAGFGSELGLATQVFVRIDLGDAALAIEQVRTEEAVASARDRARADRVRANMRDAQDFVRAGESDRYAYVLAQDPTRASAILTEFQNLAEQRREGAIEFIGKLVDEGVVQRHELDQQVQSMLRFAQEGLTVRGQVPEATGLPAMPLALPKQVPAPFVTPVAQGDPDAWQLRPPAGTPPRPPASRDPRAPEDAGSGDGD